MYKCRNFEKMNTFQKKLINTNSFRKMNKFMNFGTFIKTCEFMKKEKELSKRKMRSTFEKQKN